MSKDMSSENTIGDSLDIGNTIYLSEGDFAEAILAANQMRRTIYLKPSSRLKSSALSGDLYQQSSLVRKYIREESSSVPIGEKQRSLITDERLFFYLSALMLGSMALGLLAATAFQWLTKSPF